MMSLYAEAVRNFIGDWKPKTPLGAFQLHTMLRLARERAGERRDRLIRQSIHEIINGNQWPYPLWNYELAEAFEEGVLA